MEIYTCQYGAETCEVEIASDMNCRVCLKNLCGYHLDACEERHVREPEPGIDYRDDQDLADLFGFAHDAMRAISAVAHDGKKIEQVLHFVHEQQIEAISRYREDYRRCIQRELNRRTA